MGADGLNCDSCDLSVGRDWGLSGEVGRQEKGRGFLDVAEGGE